MIISFVGPFSWEGTPDSPRVFDVREAIECGIYLWTVPLQSGHLIYYVGQTGVSFSTRLRKHYREHCDAKYHIHSAVEFARGEKVRLWPGLWDVDESNRKTNRKSQEECRANRARLGEPIREMAGVLRFFLAPLSCDDRIRRRIEAAIALPLYELPGNVGLFQEKGIIYHRRRNAEEPIECVITSPVPLLGLPERFWA